MSELLRCPFCGSTRLTTIGSESIRCLDCLCTLYTPLPVYKNESLDDLIERWNRRHYPPEVQKAVERMKPVVIKPKLLDEYNPDGYVHLIKCENCKQEYKIIGFDFSNVIRHCGTCGQAYLLDWE